MLCQAEAGTFPLLFYYFDLFFTPRDLAQLWGNGVLVSTQVSSVVAAPIATLILTSLNGVAGQAGWRWVYFVLGGAALVCGIIVGLFLIDPPETTNILTRCVPGLVFSCFLYPLPDGSLWNSRARASQNKTHGEALRLGNENNLNSCKIDFVFDPISDFHAPFRHPAGRRRQSLRA